MNENETRKTNYAAIDIGSNAVRLLIKEIKDVACSTPSGI